MSELIAPVVDGVIAQQASASEKKPTRGTSELGKDAFLQLLVTQMQHQDPLQPSTDTEYISQLATFSQLESLQNLNAAYEHTQAFSLVGKSVILKTSGENEKLTYVSGTVDFVNMSGKNVKLSVNGNLYDMKQLHSVIDEQYLLEQGLPSLPQEYKFTFDADTPTPINFEVNLGEGETKASEVAILLDGTLLDASLYSMEENKVSIKAEVFESLPNGIYKPAVVFNDPFYTTVTDEITVTVIHSEVAPKIGEEAPKTDEPETDEPQGEEPVQTGA